MAVPLICSDRRRRRRLLQGASVVAFVSALAAPSAYAQLAALHGAAHVSSSGSGAPSIAVPTVPGLSTNAAAAVNRQLVNAGKAQQAVNLALQAQTAAQQAAAAVSGNVPNGLGVGGLQPVANPTSAANDLTGLNTWQGANFPTQSTAANGAVTVTVKQTTPQAVLDWTTFNVGANTTLDFDQSQNGVAEPNWVVLNRVVGQLDPNTGLRNPNLAPAPSQILGAIKSQGLVLVINQNGILFGPTAQINTNSLIATSLEIGAQLATGSQSGASTSSAANLADRDAIFLQSGLLDETQTLGASSSPSSFGELNSQETVASIKNGFAVNQTDPLIEGAVVVEAGAQITSGQNGFILLAAPTVTNSGVLTSSQGQVSLAAGRDLKLYPSTGAATTPGTTNIADIRGLVVSIADQSSSGADFVYNTSTGLIQSPEGFVSLSSIDTVINAGVITATTSVSRNGFILLSGANIDLKPTSVLAITPDDSSTIPQDPTSLLDFAPSKISIGAFDANPSDSTFGVLGAANVNIESSSLIYAPGANIAIGGDPSGVTAPGTSTSGVFIDSGAVIDASGLKNVPAPASTVTITPVTANDTADTPADRALLDNATVTVDIRLSGVRADGTAWVGSPLLPAKDFAEQIPVTASQLLTTGGNVFIGGTSSSSGVTVKPGATIDVSGGWTTFAAGRVQTTELIDTSGRIVPIGQADPNDTYVGIYTGFMATEPNYGLSQSFPNPLLLGAYYEAAYTQGADAGSLTIQSSKPILQGAIFADAFTGPLQAASGVVGTTKSAIPGDARDLQGAGSQLPAAGLLFIDEGGLSSLGGGDVEISDQPGSNNASGLSYGQTTSVSGGVLSVASTSGATPASYDGSTLVLSAPQLSGMGLGQLSIYTSGALTVDTGADLALAPGGVFSAITDRTITINGSITAPSGSISLQTVGPSSGAGALSGSIFHPTTPGAGSYDVAVNGVLSTAGLWTNDFDATAATAMGPGYINGGSISINVAARQDTAGFSSGGSQPTGDISATQQAQSGAAPDSTTDISGSILIDGPHSLLNVSAGGYVAPNGTLTLTAKGGNVSLIDNTAYFQTAEDTPQPSGDPTRSTGSAAGIRVGGVTGNPGTPSSTAVVAINPSAITSKVAIGDGAIEGYGFSGGVFSLTTPYIAFGSGIASAGTNLPLDFFSKAGFGTYNITSYATDLIPNAFSNGLGGYNAVLAEQVLTVQSGQTLSLTQTGYSPHVTGAQIAALRGLATGGQMSSVLSPTIQPDGFDQLPISLNLGGLVELEVAPGGQVTGAAGASLSASQIYNRGSIVLPGGTLSQSESLPELYTASYLAINFPGLTVYSGASLSQIFSVNPDGSISESAPSIADPKLTNGQLAATDPIYLTGDLPANVGIELAPGSVTNLAGVALVNPYAPQVTQGHQVSTGVVVGGGVLQTAAPDTIASSNPLFTASAFETNPAFAQNNLPTQQPGLTLVAARGSSLDLSGASATFDQLQSNGLYQPTLQWSNGGALTAGAGETLTGAVIHAQGGAPQATGGVLTVSNLTLAAVDPTTPTANVLSAQQIQDSGFGTLVVQGSLSTSGAPVDLTLPQAFYLESLPASTLVSTPNQPAVNFPTFNVAGSLQINAPYISLDSAYQTLISLGTGSGPATGDVVLNAQALDVTGAVLFGPSVANVTLAATGDLRLIGVTPFQAPGQTVAPSLAGQLAVNGDLTLQAAQVYATTGSTFDVSSSAANGVITIASSGATPGPAYSAGSNLTVQAAIIVQNGTLLAPVGSLTLGGGAPLSLTANYGSSSDPVTFAPATSSVTLGSGSVTSVSANGLSIPYGTTTDQTEYFFTPTNSNPLTAPPAGVLNLNGQSVTTASGAKVDISGGGDLYAYEFIPGTGGSHDVLSQFNTDVFTANNGFQFADQRQVYAIVPALSSTPVAAYDPLYSANYASLYGSSLIGQRVHLDGGPGVPAGWYTLLPAQYATLPGGMEVVENTSAAAVAKGASTVLADGTVEVSGQFGGLGGATQSQLHMFDIKNQTVIFNASDIALTSANSYFAAQASAQGVSAPRLPIDAGALVISATQALNLNGDFATAPASGGRGSQVDIAGAVIDIDDQAGPTVGGALQISAAQLSNLNADSLLIGGTHIDNPDGTTTLDVTAHQITVGNDASAPLTAPNIILAVDGAGSGITLKDGADIVASGAYSTSQTGAYVLNGATAGQTGQGALVLVSSGAPRPVTRENQVASAQPNGLVVGAASLSGNSVLLDSSGGFSLASSAHIQAANLGLDATNISFAPSAQGLTGLVITPALLASLEAAQTLSLRSPNPISFTAGTYAFDALNLDTPGLLVTGGGATTLNASGAAQIQNSFADAGACTTGGALACGSGQLALSAQSLVLGDGSLHLYGAGQGVSLSAASGIFVQGQATLDVGAAPLAIQTPYLGDQANATTKIGTTAELPSLALSTTGALTLSNPTGAATPDVSGVPGASVSLSGQSISVTGVDVRATAGTLTLTAANGIVVGAGTTLETPGYARNFGDASDPFSVTAPGGALTLTAQTGDIVLAAGSTLSVGGGTGQAGVLTLNAPQGGVSFGGALNGSAPTGGASFFLTEAGGFNLTSFATTTGGAFNGDVSIETGLGDLSLAAGQTLAAANVSLTADNGLVDIAGAINTNGVNGGIVALYGASGVTLESSALISARASGYAANNATQAQGGQVTLGTTGTGALTVASGAVIDVGVDQASARAVETVENGTVNYQYVPGDLGGTVTLRAPVISTSSGGETVNVNFAGAIQGASSVVLEGYRAWDLGQVAAGGQFTGVTQSGGVVTLNTTTAGTPGQPNFLADNAPGTLVNFIQTFDVSAAYGNLGGLASQSNFHARPGVELDYSGDVTLASNWNLGAGVVNVAGAVAAGLMVPDQAQPGLYTILPGDEAAVFSNYTNLTYRVGGQVLGEPGVLTLKAGGQLTLNGSITDGFFTFGDQTDQTYLNTVIGADKSLNGVIGATCAAGCANIINYSPTAPTNATGVSLAFNGTLTTAAASVSNSVPYDAAANTPGAQGTGAPGYAGDPIASAELFPLVQTSSGQVAAGSWSYQLTGGALAGSANPLSVRTGAAGGVTVQNNGASYNYGGTTGSNSLSNNLLFGLSAQLQVTADQFVGAEENANPGLTNASLTKLSFSLAPASVKAALLADATAFVAQNPGQANLIKSGSTVTGLATSLSMAGAFLQEVSDQWSSLKSAYKINSVPSAAHTVQITPLIRTGTGSIALAAAGDINLQNGATPTYLNPLTGATATASTGAQLGGAAIYTAGVMVEPSRVTAVDTTTGALVTLDPSAFATEDENVGVVPYGYGAATPANGEPGLQGVLVANPVYAQGGGDVSLTAGKNVLGRRDAYTAAQIALSQVGNAGSFSFIGSSTQPWRVGSVGLDTNILINPQLFTEGVGTLGGGNIAIRAGGNVSDLSVVADTTATTAKASSAASGLASRGLLTYGGGNIDISAAGDLLGGRVDLASGVANISVGGDVASAGEVNLPTFSRSLLAMPDTLRLRLTNGDIDLSVRGSATLDGVTALGVDQPDTTGAGQGFTNNADAQGFYSSTAGLSILANGTVSLANAGANSDLRSDPILNQFVAVLPGTLSAVSMEGNLDLAGGATEGVLLAPSPTGTLTLAAGADISAVTLAMLDNDPGTTPGLFSSFTPTGVASLPFAFPAVLPQTSFAELELQHDPAILHLGDTVPNRVYAGGDIDDVVLSVPKQTRIGAGQDIVNMMFFGQNLTPNDVTRIVAGRDITATSALEQGQTGFTTGPGGTETPTFSSDLPTLQGNTFVIGGPGSLWIEAGRNLGPFLTSATITQWTDTAGKFSSTTSSYGGGILSVGDSWDPWLPQQGSSLYVEFGVSKGQDFDALSNYYLNPANFANLPDYLFNETQNSNNLFVPNRNQPLYSAKLIAWMQANQSADLMATYGTINVSYDQAYTAFAALPELQQRPFLLQVYYNELALTSQPGPTFDNYTRGYTAVNLLFPASLGYTANNLGGGSNGANTQVHTGSLDLRLATIQTQWGGDVDILGPGGEVLAGSTVATAQQAARRNAAAELLYSGNPPLTGGRGDPSSDLANVFPFDAINSIPAGFEGVLTLRGGAISTFTDGGFILNQSRVFTEQGGDIIMWSSNGDINAGEGPKTSSDFPPVQVLIDSNAFSQLNAGNDVTGAGIGAFQLDPDVPASDVFLIAPRGTVDAGAAGVRVSGNLFVAALHVANADNFSVKGASVGLPPAQTAVTVSAQATNAGSAATQAAQAISEQTQGSGQDRSIITVEVLGFGDGSCPDATTCGAAGRRQ